ncbi:MAG: sugar-binding protein [Armatimonadota bacterium]
MQTKAFVGFLAVLAVTAGYAATLKTGEGLTLNLSDTGRITSMGIGNMPLPLKGQGGFAIADFKHQPAPLNLIPNGDFENGSTGWSLDKYQSLDTSIAHSGKGSMRLLVPGPEPQHSNLQIIVPVKPNTRYKVGMWLRREKVGVCGVYSSERGEQGQLTGKQGQVGAYIPKTDGEWLPLSWEITTEQQTTKLSLRGDIYKSTGTLWLDGFFVYEMVDAVYEPISGKITSTPEGVAFAAALPEKGLQVQATLKSDKRCLRVDGVVSDTTGEDRAIGLRFALPLDLSGWNWWTEPEEKQAIAPGQPSYRHTYNCQSGIGKCSIYPWSAVTGEKAGLGLALPLSQGPRVFIIEHEQKTPELSLSFFFALSKDAGANPSRAPFSFVLYPVDPQWGMRSAMARYYELFPESFVKRPTFEGYLNYAQLETFDPKTHNLIVNRKPIDDASDWGEGYKFLDHVHGCYDYRQVPYADPKLPSDQIVFSLLDKMIEEQKTAKSINYVPTAETLKKICFGPEQQILYIGDTKYWRPQEGYNHTDAAGWGLNFRVNEDPGISPFLMNRDRAKAEAYAKTEHQPWDACFTADAIEGYMSNSHALDFRREHFKTTLPPLTFGKGNLQPALPNTIWDYLHKAWKPITDEHKIATYGNSNGYEQAFTLPYVDIPMTEGSWDPQHPGRLDRYLRGMAHHKIWRYWHAWDQNGGYGDRDPQNVRLQLQRCLQYAIYPPVYCIEAATADLEQWRGEFRQYVPAIEELSTAGWEPVPYAQATSGVVIERYGSFAKGTLHFTLRNESDKPVETVLTLDRKGLGIPAGAKLLTQDILRGAPVFRTVEDTRYTVPLEPQQAHALWIGTPLQGAHNGFRLAAATIEKLKRMYPLELAKEPGASEGLDEMAALMRSGIGANEAKCLKLSVLCEKEIYLTHPSGGKPVDLMKLWYRSYIGASYAPGALLGLQFHAPRLVKAVPPGQPVTLPVALYNPQGHKITGFEATVLSPWDDVEGDVHAGNLTLSVPAAPQRRLLPYLLRNCGIIEGKPFIMYTPIDVVVGPSVTASIQPLRVFRGSDRKLMLTFTNHLEAAATVKLKLTPPAKTALDVTETTLQLPAKGTVAQPLNMTLQPTTFLGDTRVAYTITSDDSRFNTTGTVQISVSDPVPQLPISRLPAAPIIDGKLDDASWTGAPSIPELRVLSNGDPAAEKTAVWAAYDAKGLYAAFRCSESQMAKLVAKHTDRGAPLYQDDDVELFISVPSKVQNGLLTVDTTKVYQFAVNANGAQSDNFGNKTNWKGAAQKGERDWTVEVFIPYDAIGATGPPAPGLSWGMQFGRQQKAKGETTSWTKGPSFIQKEGFGEIIFQ